MFDADAQEGVEEADGVFGNELFERNEKCCAESEHTVDWSWAVKHVLACFLVIHWKTMDVLTARAW